MPGRPVAPSNYKTAKEARFLRWLVSGDPATLGESGKPPSTAKTANSVALVGENTVDSTTGNLQVHLPPFPVNVSGKKGAFAWWVGGENQKARLPKPALKAPENEAQWAATVKSDPTGGSETVWIGEGPD